MQTSVFRGLHASRALPLFALLALTPLVTFGEDDPRGSDDRPEEELYPGSQRDIAPPDLTGPHTWTVFNKKGLVGSYPVESKVLRTEPTLVEVTGLPWGQVHLLSTATQDWDVYLNGIGPTPLKWGSNTGTFLLENGGFQAFVDYRPIQELIEVPSTPTIPGQIGWIQVIPKCSPAGEKRGVKFIFHDAKGVAGASRNWIQCFHTVVEWKGTNTMTGMTEYGVAMPPSMLTPTGNANMPVDASGGHVYVDSGAPGSSHYESDFLGGDEPGYTWMDDGPAIMSSDWLPGAAGAPAHINVTEYTWVLVVTTYLEVCDEIVYSFDWVYHESIPWPYVGPTPIPAGGELLGPAGSPTTEMQDDHQKARERFEAGDFTGAENT